MKTTNYFYSVIFLCSILCASLVCRGDDHSNEFLKKLKSTLASYSFAVGTIANHTNDANRAEVLAELKEILSQGLDPKAKYSYTLLGNALEVYVTVTKEDSATICATLQPFLNYPDPDIQSRAARFIAKSGDPSALGLLKPKLEEAESNLPDINSFTQQTEKKTIFWFRNISKCLLLSPKLRLRKPLNFVINLWRNLRRSIRELILVRN